MTYERKARPGFGADKVVALLAPVEPMDSHRPHQLDEFTIETNNGDTATIYLREVNLATSTIPVTRQSMPVPLSLLVDLAQRRPMTPAETEAFAQWDEEEFGDDTEEAK